MSKKKYSDELAKNPGTLSASVASDRSCQSPLRTPMAWNTGDMTDICLAHGLLFGSASLLYSGKQLNCINILTDTGSAGTVFSVEKVLTIGVHPEPDDSIRELRGVGGTEFVFVKKIDKLTLGDFRISDFEIEIGAYGLRNGN